MRTHFLGQIPQPMQSSSEMNAILDVGATSMQSLPVRGRSGPLSYCDMHESRERYAPMRTTGHDFLHSCLHFLGLHRSGFTSAMRVSFSDILVASFSVAKRRLGFEQGRPCKESTRALARSPSVARSLTWPRLLLLY